MEIQDIKSKDWAFSLQGVGEVVQSLDDIRQCIYIILTTQKGTDPTRPDFGCGIYEYVDEPVNIALPNMKREIIQAIATYEPRAKIIRILHEINEAKITFKIEWEFNLSDTQTLEITI